MSIVAVHGPNTFGSKAVIEVGPAMAVLQPLTPRDGLKWTFKLDQSSTRTTSLAWTFPTGTPSTATGPGPHNVTFASAGTKAVTAVATGVGEGANPYPPAGTTNLPVTAVSGTAPSLMMGAPGGDEEEVVSEASSEEEPEIDVGYDPAAHTVEEVLAYVEEHPDQAAEMLAAEQSGKARVTLVSQLEDLAFDPADHTVTEVISFVEDHPDRLDDIIAAEEAGKNRVTLINHLGEMRSE